MPRQPGGSATPSSRFRLATKQGGGLRQRCRCWRGCTKRTSPSVPAARNHRTRRPRSGGDPERGHDHEARCTAPARFALPDETRQRPSGQQGEESRKPTAGLERDIVRVGGIAGAGGQGRALGPSELDIVVRPLAGTRGRLVKHVNHEVRLFHAKSMISVRLVRRARKAEAVKERMKNAAGRHACKRSRSLPWSVRRWCARYRLGPTDAGARSARWAWGTGRLDQSAGGSSGHVPAAAGRA